MVNRWSALWLIVGLIAGYAVAAPSARAQGTGAIPFAVDRDDKITLHFEQGALTDRVTSVGCIVEEEQGAWIRCRSADIFQPHREQLWYSSRYVTHITKQQK